MSLRDKIILFTVLSFLSAIFVGAYHQFSIYKELAEKEREKLCVRSEREFNHLVEFHKKVADSISSYIANSSEVKALLRAGKREELYEKLRPLYREVSERKLVEEIMIFKLPATLFLSMKRPKEFNQDSSKRRIDVVKVGKTCTATTSFIICANYAGIRAIHPIAEGKRVLGVVSVGIDMEDFLKRYSEVTGLESALAVKEEVLKSSLKRENYEKLRKEKSQEGSIPPYLQLGRGLGTRQ